MPDAVFADPRLAALYDVLDPDRSDLEAYVDLALELGARSVLDAGCGTGTFALMLAEWMKLLDVRDGLVSFRAHDELDAGVQVLDVRDAPDRPGNEWVYLARRAG